ncbi:hypothetical protein PVK06_026517 [Gossypium arboreum]|uniref:Uncharacterized protein n=1 Tax=Gossypium arboreum TaxID=29729 RepID=A0ABR0P0S2_GOSAR|nr:hypothetical protein PVK06_026517 [Gossypium arboreum]
MASLAGDVAEIVWTALEWRIRLTKNLPKEFDQAQNSDAYGCHRCRNLRFGESNPGQYRGRDGSSRIGSNWGGNPDPEYSNDLRNQSYNGTRPA